MYKKWNKKDIRNYLNQLELESGFALPKIRIKIFSDKNLLGYCYRIVDENQGIGIVRELGFNKAICNGYIKPKYVKQIIKHEFCHAWTEHKSKRIHYHDAKFNQKCNVLHCELNSSSLESNANNNNTLVNFKKEVGIALEKSNENIFKKIKIFFKNMYIINNNCI